MSIRIPQSNPKANYLAHREAIDAAIQRTLQSGWYILGAEVKAFEADFADFLGASSTIGVANGTEAIELALRALDIGCGDAVFTVSHTAVATVSATVLTGATPVLIDIDPARYTMCPDRLQNAILSVKAAGKLKPRAIIPVHLYGHPAAMTDILRIASEHGLSVIEDCAQCHGATFEGRTTGTMGNLAAFSFYPTKNLGALGDGGAIATSTPALAEKVRLLREYGWKERYVSAIPGKNSRLDELQAGILRVKLSHLATENRRRAGIADAYDSGLAGLPLQLPKRAPGITHVYHQYVIRSANRDSLKTRLAEAGIGTLIHYPMPVHLQPGYAGMVICDPKGMAETEKASREILSLPMHPVLTDAEVAEVIATIRSLN